MGGGIGKILAAVSTGGLSLIPDLLGVDSPNVPGVSDIATGQRAKEGTGSTFDETESDARRKSVRKNRLGTNALQIPLEKTSTGAATSTATGIKV